MDGSGAVGGGISRTHNGEANSINIIQKVQYYLRREITYGYDGDVAKKLRKFRSVFRAPVSNILNSKTRERKRGNLISRIPISL